MIRFFFILADNEDMHKISDEFEFRPGRTTDYGVSCPWASEKFPIDLKWENGVSKLWRLIHAKNPDLQTMYTSIVNVYFLNTAM